MKGATVGFGENARIKNICRGPSELQAADERRKCVVMIKESPNFNQIKK